MDKVIMKLDGVENSDDIAVYLKHGGYEVLKKAFKTAPDDITKMVKDSGMRGRGGAGFPTGVKWGFLAKHTDERYLLCNADESEPGTFKDRWILEHDPHQMIEGMIISAFALGAKVSYIYIRGEFTHGARILEKAIQQAYDKGFLGKNILKSGFDHDMTVHRGAGAYICGEETGLIESLEGKRGWPRTKPPFPAVAGVFQKPTIVNNVETLACVTHIMNYGAEWFKENEPKLYALSGHVNNPGVFELKMGTNLKDIIYEHGKGIWKGRKLKAVIPGGSSVPVLTADEVDVAMDFDSVGKYGSSLGSSGIMVMDDQTCMVDTLLNISKFYSHESCGQCTPCREGTHWLEGILDRIEHGRGREQDLDMLVDIANKIAGRTICPLGDAAAWPVAGMPNKETGKLSNLSFVHKFRDEFEYHIKNKKCMVSLPASDWN